MNPTQIKAAKAVKQYQTSRMEKQRLVNEISENMHKMMERTASSAPDRQ